MTVDDLPLLHGWLQEPETAHWYRFDDLSSVEAVAEHYGPALAGEEAVDLWIVRLDGCDAGFLQSYRLVDHPGYRDACVGVGADPGAGAVDYLLGDPGDRDHGVGSAVLRMFVEDVAFDVWGWPAVVASPEPANVRSLRALAKAGFRLLGDIEGEDGPERVMQRDRLAG
jgi:aminoglycoside 6'-N-acetyltransferase